MKSILNGLKRFFAIRQMADFFEKVERNPVTRTPAEVGLDFENVEFKSLDGVNLSGWYIHAENNEKVVVFNHFLIGNKAGAAPNKDWGNIGVDFMPIYKHLVDAGYDVFTYDLRNHGESDVHNNGHLGLTHVEYQDSVASVRYAKEHFPGKKLYLYSQCYGAVATMRAMEKHPEEFEGISAFVNLQPLSADAFVSGVCRKFGLEHESNIVKFSNRLKKKTGYEVDQLRVPDLAPSVNIPTMLVQVRNDWRTTSEDLEKIYEDFGTSDKKLLWIENEDERLEGYNYFAKNPKELIQWLNSH